MGQKTEHSNLIRENLKERGITQTWLAKELGMSFSITNAYVCNCKQPNLATIFKVADLLGVSPQTISEIGVYENNNIDILSAISKTIEVNMNNLYTNKNI